ncbi:MAG: creatininase family protein [Bacillota bacterium]
MAETKKRLYLPEMTWPELKDALPKVKMAIIPVGSHEQHGPHGTFQFDTACSTEFSLLLGERLYPEVVVAPGVPVGISTHHMNFPGTITLQPETLIQVLTDMAKSLMRHGIKEFLFVNGHGGNTPALTIVVNRLRQDFDCEAMWATLPYDVVGDISQKYVKSPTSGHSCEGEVSIMMYLKPDAVRTSALSAAELNPKHVEAMKDSLPVKRGSYFDDVTINGCLGDARKATPEIGKEMVEAALERLVPYLKKRMAR